LGTAKRTVSFSMTPTGMELFAGLQLLEMVIFDVIAVTLW
jgi:hypothetical protein